MSKVEAAGKGATGGKGRKKSQAGEFRIDPKTAAFFHYLHVYGTDPVGGDRHLPRTFGRLAAKPMSDVATARELERAKKTVHPLIWRFLRSNPPKDPNSQTDLLAKIHRRLGPPGDDYIEWWKKIGRVKFADDRTPGVFCDGVFQDGDEEEDFPRLLVLRVFLTKTKTELYKEFEQILAKVHPGKKHTSPFHDDHAFGQARANHSALEEQLEVWHLRQAHPALSWPDIAKKRKKYARHDAFDAVKRKEAGDDTQSVHAKAVKLLRHWTGERPSSVRSKRGA